MHLIVGSDGPLIDAAKARNISVTVLALPAAIQDIGDFGLASGQKGTWRYFLVNVPMAAWSAWRYARRLRKLVTGLQPAVVHSNGIKFHFLTRVAKLQHTIVVWHIRDFLGSRTLMGSCLRWASRSVAGAIANSNAVAKDACRVLPSLPVAVVHNAVDTDYFSPGPGDGSLLDRLANLEPADTEVVRIGLVATYALWKGHDVFIQAARQVRALRPEARVRFYIVGGPIYQTRGSQWTEDELRRQGADLLAEGKLGFPGFQQDIHEVYRALDIVVHASTRPEPFGLTIAEAMACGRAVIVTQSGGATELFESGHDAVGVSPGSAEELANAIIDLVTDPGKRQSLGQEARATALARFRRERLGPQILDAYSTFGAALSSGAPPGRPAQVVL
jgi:glycosyltransferase involved in cell wall biosynthesis